MSRVGQRAELPAARRPKSLPFSQTSLVPFRSTWDRSDPNQGSRALLIHQTCRGAFSAISKPIGVSKYSSELQHFFKIYMICALLHRPKLKISRSLHCSAKFRRISRRSVSSRLDFNRILSELREILDFCRRLANFPEMSRKNDLRKIAKSGKKGSRAEVAAFHG